MNAEDDKARALFEERLIGVKDELFRRRKETTRTTAAPAAMLDEARELAEEAREQRRAEAVIAHKLYEKEMRARERLSLAKKQARVEARQSKTQKTFDETKAVLDNAAKEKQRRLEEKENIKRMASYDAAMLERLKNLPELSKDEVLRLRKKYADDALNKADAEDAARAADAARRALLPIPSGDNKKAAVEQEEEMSKKNSRGKKMSKPLKTTEDRKQRSAILESLRHNTLATTGERLFESVQNVVARATSLGLADDCPELLEAKLREHDLGVKHAKTLVDRAQGEHAFATDQYTELVAQGFNRAAERARRRLDDAWVKKLDAEGSIQYHEAQLSAVRSALADERERRQSSGLPEYMIDDPVAETMTTPPIEEERPKSPPKKKKKKKRSPRPVSSHLVVVEKKEIDREKLAAAREAEERDRKTREAAVLLARQSAAVRAKETKERWDAAKVQERRRARLRADAAEAQRAATMALRRLDKIDTTPTDVEAIARKQRARADAARRNAQDLARRKDALVQERYRILWKDPESNLVAEAKEDTAASFSEAKACPVPHYPPLPADCISRPKDDANSLETPVPSPPKPVSNAKVLALHYVHDPSNLAPSTSLSLQMHVPDSWRSKPISKLLKVFATTYSRKFGSALLAKDLGLETADGRSFDAAIPISDVLPEKRLRVVLLLGIDNDIASSLRAQ